MVVTSLCREGDGGASEVSAGNPTSRQGEERFLSMPQNLVCFFTSIFSASLLLSLFFAVGMSEQVIPRLRLLLLQR